MIPGTPDSPPFRTLPRHTWSKARSEEWQRLANHEAITPATNAQRKAHPWKVARREQNKTKHAQLQHDIEVTLHYVDNFTQTTPPPSPPSFCYHHSHSSVFSPPRQNQIAIAWSQETPIHTTPPHVPHPLRRIYRLITGYLTGTDRKCANPMLSLPIA